MGQGEKGRRGRLTKVGGKMNSRRAFAATCAIPEPQACAGCLQLQGGAESRSGVLLSKRMRQSRLLAPFASQFAPYASGFRY